MQLEAQDSSMRPCFEIRDYGIEPSEPVPETSPFGAMSLIWSPAAIKSYGDQVSGGRGFSLLKKEIASWKALGPSFVNMNCSISSE